jgi:hypothetical protein
MMFLPVAMTVQVVISYVVKSRVAFAVELC